MRRLSIILAALSALVLASCAKEPAAQPVNEEEVSQEMVAASFTAQLLPDGQTKATIDGDGAGIYADRCRLQVWFGNVLYCDKTVAVNNYKAEFNNILLMQDQTYDFLFWADNTAGNYYVTDTLTKVQVKTSTYVGNDDKRDAFYGAVIGKTVTKLFTETVTLKRPFAQLNVITTDIPAIWEQIPEKSQFASVVPNRVKLTIFAPSRFNVKTGVADGEQMMFYTTGVYTNPYKTTTGSWNTLSMDYFLAPEAESNVVSVNYVLDNSESGIEKMSRVFTQIPLRRNYRTNIIGALLSTTGNFEVTINPDWNLPEYDIEK